MQLVAYGAQDAYLTGNPNITFFKVVYRKHTNFAVESIENTFSGSADFGKRVQCQIVRNGDLITKTYLKVTLAGVDSGNTLKKWAWVSKLGHALLKNVELNIGGTQIDKHYGDWLNMWYELSRNTSHDRGYDKMIGNTQELCNLSRSHDQTTVYVPLQFFFCRNEGLSLPLIALQYHDVRINFEFRSLNECILHTRNITPSSDLKDLKFVDASLYIDYVFLDTEERKRFAQNPHEYLVEQLQFTGEESVSQTNQKFKLNFNHPTKALYWGVKLGKYTIGSYFLAYNSNLEDMRLLATRRFVLRCAKYAVGILDATLTENKIGPSATLTPNLLTMFNEIDGRYLSAASLDSDNITVFGRLLTDVELSTDVSTLFNNFTSASPDSGDGNEIFDVVVRQWDNYGLYLNKVGNPVSSGLVQLNGHNRFSERDGNYFNYVQPWQHHKCTPADGINMYSFALHPEDHQPSGTCNMSRIDNATLALTFNTAVNSGDNKISIYAVNYNVLRILSGMGGLAYSN